MTVPPARPGAATTGGVSPMLRSLAILLLVVPLLGTAVHIAMYVMAIGSAEGQDWVRAYIRGPALKVVGFATFVCLLGNWFHYRRTRMTLDIVSRIAIYVWILTIVLLLRGLWLTKSL